MQKMTENYIRITRLEADDTTEKLVEYFKEDNPQAMEDKSEKIVKFRKRA